MSDVDIHQHTRHAYADEALDDAARTHLDECTDCQTWTRRLDNILAAAPSAYPTPNSGRIDDVLTAVSDAPMARSSQRHVRWLAVASAVVIVTAGAIVAIRGDGNEDEGVLASAAAALRDNSDGIEFIYDATATVNLAPADRPVDATPLSFTPLPACAAPSPSTPPPTVPGRNVDLDGALEALTNPDPCDGLQQLSATIGQQTTATLQDLADTEATATAVLDQLDNDDTTPLTAATADVVRQRAEHARQEAGAAAEQLVVDANNAAASLQDFATAAASGDDTSVHQTAAVEGLTALADTLDRPPTPDQITTEVTWQQLATGTWRPDAPIDLTGNTTQADDDAAETTFDSADNDPLGIADVVLSDPDTITDILAAGPHTDDPTTTYTIPAETLPANPLNVDTWTVTVTTDDGVLHELALTAGDPTTGSTITITVTPARAD